MSAMMFAGLTNLLTQAINQATTSDPSNVTVAQQLIAFAEGVAEEVLRRAGFIQPKMVVIGGVHQMDRDGTSWSDNMIASTAERPEEGPDDMLEGVPSLWLNNVPTTLDTSSIPRREMPLKVHEFVFCANRVIEWNSERDRVQRVLTYEETARFILFWLAEKILQIIRKNEWDKVRQMPELYDRLAMVVTPPARLYPFVLTQELGGENDDEEQSVHAYVGTIYAENLREAAERTGLKVIDEETTEDEIVLEMTRCFAPKFRLRPERDITHSNYS